MADRAEVEGRDDSALVRLRERREQIRSTAPRAEAAYFDVSLIDRVLDVLAAVAQTPATPLDVEALKAGAEACLAQSLQCERVAKHTSDAALLKSAKNWRSHSERLRALVLPPQPTERPFPDELRELNEWRHFRGFLQSHGMTTPTPSNASAPPPQPTTITVVVNGQPVKVQAGASAP